MAMNEAIIIVPVVFGAFVWFAWIIFNTVRRHKAARMQADLQGKLLDKFNSSQDLLAYVQTDAGQNFMGSLASEQSTPYGRILSAVQSSVMLISLGLAFLYLKHRIFGSEDAFLVVGTVTLTLGIAFAVAAALSYVLSKSFGLLEQNKN
jgi:hypothetical protein